MHCFSTALSLPFNFFFKVHLQQTQTKSFGTRRTFAIMVDIRSGIRSFLFTYETPKMVHIESKLTGLLHRIMQLILFVVVVVWIFIINNGYQYVDNGAVSATTTKLKGIAHSNSSDKRVGERIWDPADLHVPPQDNGAFFLATNVIVTKEQVQAVCTDVEYATKCTKDSDCLNAGMPYHLGHGLSVGVCNQTTNYCVVDAWCPIENDSLPEGGKFAALNHTKDFTVFIKNHVYFPLFEEGRSSVVESTTKKYLRRCHYHPLTDPYCPIFRVGTIVGMAGRGQSIPDRSKDDEYFQAMAIKGGVVSITIKWDCNFDFDPTDCKPEYKFRRLDNFHTKAVSPGYNFRYPMNYVEDGINKRQLVKAFGILFILNVDALARGFDVTTFLLNIGSSVALIGIATILSHIFIHRFHRNRQYFAQFTTEPVVTIDRRMADTNRKASFVRKSRSITDNYGNK